MPDLMIYTKLALKWSTICTKPSPVPHSNNLAITIHINFLEKCSELLLDHLLSHYFKFTVIDIMLI